MFELYRVCFCILWMNPVFLHLDDLFVTFVYVPRVKWIRLYVNWLMWCGSVDECWLKNSDWSPDKRSVGPLENSFPWRWVKRVSKFSIQFKRSTALGLSKLKKTVWMGVHAGRISYFLKREELIFKGGVFKGRGTWGGSLRHIMKDKWTSYLLKSFNTICRSSFSL